MMHGYMIVILISLEQCSCVLNFELVSEPSDDGRNIIASLNFHVCGY